MPLTDGIQNADFNVFLTRFLHNWEQAIDHVRPKIQRRRRPHSALGAPLPAFTPPSPTRLHVLKRCAHCFPLSHSAALASGPLCM
jgi:hypothetical protein